MPTPPRRSCAPPATSPAKPGPAARACRAIAALTLALLLAPVGPGWVAAATPPALGAPTPAAKTVKDVKVPPHPSTFEITPQEDARATTLLNAVPAIAGVPCVYRQVGPRQLSLWVYRPPGATSAPAPASAPASAPAPAAGAPRRAPTLLPAVLLVHGGGWAVGKPQLLELPARYLASRGLIAITVEYRLTREPGVSIFDCVADVKAAVRFVRANAPALGVHPQRLTLLGESAGGHLAACAAFIPGLEAPDEILKISSRPDAVVLYNPILDLLPPDGWDLARFSGAAGKAAAPRAREISPLHHIIPTDPPGPPGLILHGLADTVTPIAATDRFFDALRVQGNAHDYFRFRGVRHAFMVRGWGPDASLALGLLVTDRFFQGLGYLRGPSPLDALEPLIAKLVTHDRPPAASPEPPASAPSKPDSP